MIYFVELTVLMLSFEIYHMCKHSLKCIKLMENKKQLLREIAYLKESYNSQIFNGRNFLSLGLLKVRIKEIQEEVIKIDLDLIHG